MAAQELYHGAVGDKILTILQDGVIRPDQEGIIYFGKYESQYPQLFQYGADSARGLSFVVKVRAQIPENCQLKLLVRDGAPKDAWYLETKEPIRVEILRLFVRKLYEPVREFDAPHIAAYLKGTRKP